LNNEDWSGDFNGLFNSALGKELIRSLKEDKHDSIIREAERAQTSDEAYGLIKEASGVMLAIEHMMFLSTVPTEGEKRV
jgi:hypothetical protein